MLLFGLQALLALLVFLLRRPGSVGYFGQETGSEARTEYPCTRK